MKNPKLKLPLIVTVSVFCGAGLTAAVIGLAHHKTQSPAPTIPAAVLNDANFILYTPQQGSAWVLRSNGASYNATQGVVSISLRQAAGKATAVLTEQSTPDAFSDVPTQYSTMLNSLNEYAELQTGFGTIALTHPKELNGGQTAVVNKSGTLLFAKPSQDLTQDQWKSFFSSLHIVR